ncbi:DUF397 domain-containing protein [Nocardiopsis chromatogenes]|uniref:DUF397 domain-containing protein n=1 Tax=Nocardiopsis chromatogenes TaxID=280239 RepID=UPI0005925282|nr:DUF397 domain-containing protein [Nocardiopsis chromatogenes]
MEHLAWRKSSYSGGGAQDCVEYAPLTSGAAVRDSQNRDAGMFVFPAGEWQAFLDDVAHRRL